MPLPPVSLTKLLKLFRLKPVAGLLRRRDDLLPRHALPRIEVEDDAVAHFQLAEPRAADVNLERAGLHQRDQIVALFHCDDVVLLGVNDMAQRRLLDGGGDVLLEERFAANTLRSAHDGERPVDDVRRHKIPHARHNTPPDPVW